MISNMYRNAYTEVLVLLNHISPQEYKRIPIEKIKYMEDNQNREYVFKYDKSLPLNKQNISREANAIILYLFDLYFANDKQKEKLRKILKANTIEKEKLRSAKYDSNNIFKVRNIEIQNQEKFREKENLEEREALNNIAQENKSLIKTEKTGIIAKIKQFIIKIFKKDK